MTIDITAAIIAKALAPEVPISAPEGYSQEQFEKAARGLRRDIASSDHPFSPLSHVNIADSAKGADE